MEKYLKHCKNLFPIYGSPERQYINRLARQIEEYQSENTDCTYEDLTDQFGTPVSIVGSYYESMDEECMTHLIKRLNVAKHIRIFIIVLICALAFVFGFRSYLLYLDYRDSRTAIIHSVETTIEEE